MSIIGIIPARFASSRFPGKPLAMIDGKTMLQRVVEQSKKATLLTELVVASDDARIEAHCKEIGIKCIITSADHPSGTDRCYEAYKLSNSKSTYIINIQGDEPFLHPEQINSLAKVCDGTAELATQMIKCNTYEMLADTGEVKIVLNEHKEALYFSRSIIPFIKNETPENWHLKHDYYRHVGMYAYRADILDKISKLPVSFLEKAESLEQLRWLENGFKIKCAETTYESHCIDTPEDIEKVLKLMKH
ncbi:MAG: 3-deoxy-manno-octulosonate cytidylyltransferase [Bacteroidota bacterium]|nr:3-deoxy-manno-octulosonate cytidylyltransferase [Bacteroidota bacterium]